MTRSLRLHAAVAGLYLVVAILVTYPLVLQFSTHYAGHPFSDAYELARHIWWFKHALETGQSPFSQPLLGYPNGLDGSWLWAAPLQSFPAWLFAFVLPLPAAYNLSILLRLALNGWAAFALARHLLRGQTAPALVAGLVFMLYPTMQGHLAAGHTGLLALWPTPLYVLALVRLRETGQRRFIVAAGLLFMVATLGSTQLAIFTLFPITLVYGLALLWRREWTTLGRTALAVALGGALAAVFALPALVSEPDSAPITTGVVDYSADLLAFAAPSFYHPLFRGNDLSVRVLGVDPFEGAAYVGIGVGLLALVGLAFSRRLAPRISAGWWLALGLLAWVFSLGPVLKLFYAPVPVEVGGYGTYVTLPWLAFTNLPGISIIRTPGRFNFTVALCAAMLAAYGAAWLWTRLEGRKWPRALLPVVLVWIIFEYQFWWPLPTVEGVAPAEIAALGEREDVRAVLDAPWQHPLAAKAGLWLQTAHGLPLVAGHVTRQTPVDPALLTILQSTLDPALLDAAGADIVILHKRWAEDAEADAARMRNRLGEPVYEDDRFAVFEAPAPNAAPAFAAALSDASAIEAAEPSYVYVDNATPLVLHAELSADERDVRVLLDGATIWSGRIAGVAALDLFTDPVQPGYHTVTLAVDPPCPPAVHDETLECSAVGLRDLRIALPEAAP